MCQNYNRNPFVPENENHVWELSQDLRTLQGNVGPLRPQPGSALVLFQAAAAALVFYSSAGI